MSTEVKFVSEDDLKKKATKEIRSLERIEKNMSELKLAMDANPQFKEFLQYQEDFRKKSANLFKKLETQMIENGVKSIKGDWGSMTIVNRSTLSVEDEEMVPEEYKETKVVVDLKKVKQDAELTGEMPDGISEKTTQYLRKTIKTLKELS